MFPHFLPLLLLIFLEGAFFDKTPLEVRKEYAPFLNFGERKLSKLNKTKLENSVLKSKLDVLGEVFKKSVDSFKSGKDIDLVFLIDGSSSVGEENFVSELKFVKKLLSDVTVDFNHTRVSVVTFSSSHNVVSIFFLFLLPQSFSICIA